MNVNEIIENIRKEKLGLEGSDYRELTAALKEGATQQTKAQVRKHFEKAATWQPSKWTGAGEVASGQKRAAGAKIILDRYFS